ncbi:hypothetical protein DB347_20730 [Opitutaceae bacterium EW11]|nr:hypothetical protein DB347_20730 [Opitutaceae bacterium EW11]
MKNFFLRGLVGFVLVTGIAFAAKPVAIPSDLEGIQIGTTAAGGEKYALSLTATPDELHIVYRGANGRDAQVVFTRKKAGDLVAALDKYLEWEQLATSRGEVLTKRIASVPSISGFNVYVGFKSLEAGRHALQMGIRSKLLGDSSGSAAGIVDLLMDRPNVEKLRALAVRFQKGEPLTEAGDVYR